MQGVGELHQLRIVSEMEIYHSRNSPRWCLA
jgi:hypothetical protein